jgi:hypothetical protein
MPLVPAIEDSETTRLFPEAFRANNRELPTPIDPEHAVDQLVVQSIQIRVRNGFGESGGIYQNVQTRAIRHHPLPQRDQRIRIHDIGFASRVSVAFQSRKHGLSSSRFLGSAIGDHDPGSASREHSRGRSADRSRAPDNEDCLAQSQPMVVSAAFVLEAEDDQQRSERRPPEQGRVVSS